MRRFALNSVEIDSLQIREDDATLTEAQRQT